MNDFKHSNPKARNSLIKPSTIKAAKTLQFLFLNALFMLTACRTASLPKGEGGMLVRISAIEIYPDSLAAYKAILKEEAAASVRLEPGVVSIFPMYQQKDSTQIRILEIYANREAYQSHLKTPHFQHYKTTTLKMVKSLQLVDMHALDPETMKSIFRKLKN
jgi:quinol monooxygenase YgiN